MRCSTVDKKWTSKVHTGTSQCTQMMGTMWEGTHFMDMTLPFGLRSALKIGTSGAAGGATARMGIGDLCMIIQPA